MQASLLSSLAIVAALTVPPPAAAQTVMRCVGIVGGVQSQSAIQFERTPNTIYVAGMIQNQFASYLFRGEMFGGTQGFVSLVEQRTGERIDRVFIALTPSGYMIRPERSAEQHFECR
jgi:hypothetical protein